MPQSLEPEFHWNNRTRPILRAVVPGTDEVVQGGSNEQTHAAWLRRCGELGIEFENQFRAFHNCACYALDPSQRSELCRHVGADSPELIRQRRVIGWSDITRFLETMKLWWRADESVPQAEADRRAEICVQCEFNQSVYMPGCASCNNFVSVIAEAVGGKSTKWDASLKGCGVCGCQNSVQVHVPLDALKKAASGLDYPKWCWKNQ